MAGDGSNVVVKPWSLFWVGIVLGAMLMAFVQVVGGVIPCSRNCSCQERSGASETIDGDFHDHGFPPLGPPSLKGS